MPSVTNRYAPLTLHAELTLIKLVTRQFPGSSDISYFYEIPGKKPDQHSLSWTFNAHRILSVRMSWRTNRLHIRQELVIGEETRLLSFPIRWCGLSIVFDKTGEAILEGSAGHDFWRTLIGHDGTGIPKPHPPPQKS